MRTALRAMSILSLAAAAFLSACSVPLMPAGGPLADGPIVQHVPYTGSFSYTVDAGPSARDVYFVFTNANLMQDANENPSVDSTAVKVNGASIPAPRPQPMYSVASAPVNLVDRVAEFNRNPRAYLPKSPFPRPSAALVSTLPAQNDQAGITQGDFYTDLDPSGNGASPVTATCQAVVGPVTFADGRTRTLSIWVDDAYWTTEVTPQMVTALASRFLLSPESMSDIYHWDTSVVGEPWGPQNDPGYFIDWDPNKTVTILLTHLNTTYSGAVAVGFFWAKDNFTTVALPGSNQRIMFYIDSKLYSTLNTDPHYPTETTWAETNRWPEIIFSTLAHEFQHMIQFYQKQVLFNLGAGTDTWINEMCSMLVEDLVSDKLGVEGPRGVSPADGSAGSPGNTSGRIPYFNSYSYYPLAQTTNFGLIDYSVSYAFGAWLARNYGGAQLVRRIVQCAQTDESAVVNAAAASSGRSDESMARLLEKWSAAVILSDVRSAPLGYRYNTGGWFTSSESGISFNLGSINIFNYVPSLTVFSGSGSVPAGYFYRSSNAYYLAASGLTASQTWQITMPPDILLSIVIN